MIIAEKKNSKFIATKLTSYNQVEFEMHQLYGNVSYDYLNIKETIQLIKFLQQQVDAFNKKQ